MQALFPSLVWRKETLDKEIWLTFDDGPTPEVTPWILSILKKENVKATFFLVGQQIEEFPELVGAIIKDGHTIANHQNQDILSLGDTCWRFEQSRPVTTVAGMPQLS